MSELNTANYSFTDNSLHLLSEKNWILLVQSTRIGRIHRFIGKKKIMQKEGPVVTFSHVLKKIRAEGFT